MSGEAIHVKDELMVGHSLYKPTTKLSRGFEYTRLQNPNHTGAFGSMDQ